MRNKKIMRILLCAVLMMVIVSTFSVTAFAAGHTLTTASTVSLSSPRLRSCSPVSSSL